MPREVEPCLATLAAKVPGGDAWVHEIKWDGYRLVAFKSGGDVRLATRRGHDWTRRFPAIAEAVGGLPAETAILDGEAVILGPDGVADFSALQDALSDAHRGIAHEAVLFAFDLLYLNGEDLRPQPLIERKARLAALVPGGSEGALRLGEHVEADGEAMLRSARQLGLEGVISKRRDRPYRSGRGTDWVKVKCTQRQEFVVAGFVPSAVSPRAVGSLVLGYHEGGALRHAGRSGTGFTAATSRSLFKALDGDRRKTSPFPARLTAEERLGVTWVEPRLVAEIEFGGWTADGRLRHAAFKGLRDDKAAEEIVRERPFVNADDGASDRPAPEREAPSARGATKAGGEVAGVRLTHPERVLWDEGITKLDLARYYEEIVDWILPHVAGRPLSLVRCPEGAAKGCFFQKHAWAGLSEHIQTRTIRDGDGEEQILFVHDIRGVIGLVQASVLEIHPWGSRVDDVERPDRIVMDLDPGEGVTWREVVAAARDARERLKAVGLESFVKTTGGKGLHVVVPLTGHASWPDAKAFAKALSDAMEADAPDRYIAKASKTARAGVIYVDYLRNGRGATAVAAYSSRARPGATVSVPLTWDQLGAEKGPASATIADLPARLRRRKADPWAGLAECRQDLPTLGGRRRTRTR